jgi:hypothetical protein
MLLSLGMADDNYGDLAMSKAPLFYNKMLLILPTLTEASLPDEVRALRHNISDVRNVLDIFAFAFPNTTNGKQLDVWPKLRANLDEGYTVIGDFQDLSHSGVKYSQHDLKQRLAVCLKWRRKFEVNMGVLRYEDFIKSARNDQLFFRPTRMYSKDFWEYVGDIPHQDLSGMQNMALLERGIIGQLADNYTRVVSLTDIWDVDNHILFHDFRKLFRSANTVSGYFPGVFNMKSACTARGVADFNKAYDMFGDLNDEVTAYQFYVQHHDSPAAEAKKVQIQRDWAALKTWMTSENMPSLLACMRNSTIMGV